MILLGFITILVGIMGLLHHYLVCGRLWDWGQFWHHEPLIAIAFSIGMTLIIGGLTWKIKDRR